jgi:replicative DNA helicase
MIEIQIINSILDNRSIGILQRNKVTESYFPSTEQEIKYIMDHYREYGTVPDKSTFLSKFPEFDIFIVKEPEQYLIQTIREQKLYSDMVPIYKEAGDRLKDDSFQALEYLRSQMRSLSDTLDFLHVGKDLARDTAVRKNDYLMRVERKGLIGIPTGLEWLDELTNGWMHGIDADLITIGGYLGEGKSYLLLFLLHAAWKHARKKVLLISREMGHVMVGFRFDTWDSHFSNKGLISGQTKLGPIKKNVGSVVVDVDLTSDDYLKYLDDLQESDVPPFMLFTNEDNRSCTIDDIETLIDLHQPDIIGIDQLSLLHTVQKFTSTRDKYTFLTRELYRLTARRKIPILLAAQINRDFKKAKRKMEGNNLEAPGMDQYQDSNSIGEDSTRSITFSRKGNNLLMSLEKNRYGVGGRQEFLWDIDRGMLDLYERPPEEEEEEQEDTRKKKQSTGGNKTISSSDYIF